MNAVVEHLPSPVAEVRHQLTQMEDQFKAALPTHIPPERFMRVVMTAIQNNPQLMKAPRRELWNAAIRAAQDGLLPDGHEGALVCRPGRDGITVTWQPMIAGVRKKARNSGEIATWDAHVVFANDFFQFKLGDAPQINHSYDLKSERGDAIGAYSVAVMKDGSKSYEVMSVSDINKIRDRSDAWKAFKAGKIKSTPWSTDWGEMARKTVAKRHSKVLPMSTDLDDLIRRDDSLYEFDEAKQRARTGQIPNTLSGRLDMLAAPPTAQDPGASEGTDAIDVQPEDVSQDDGAAPEDASQVDQQDAGADLQAAFKRGREAQMTGVARKAIPGELREAGREDERDAWWKGWDASAPVDAEA